jgi:hypothetical protein
VHRLPRVLPVLAAAALLATAASAAPSAGSKAPELTARELNGKSFRLSQFRGKAPVLLNFFQTT